MIELETVHDLHLQAKDTLAMHKPFLSSILKLESWMGCFGRNAGANAKTLKCF